MDEQNHDTNRNPESDTAKTPPGLVRHRLIVGGCIALAVSMIGLSTIDFAPMVKRRATIDKSFNITYTPKLAELSPRLTYVRRAKLREGLIAVSESTWDRELIGFVDKSGKVVIKPQFAQADEFSDGLAWASPATFENGGQYGFIDKTGKFVIKPQFTSIDEFVDGTCPVILDGKGALIDKTGKVLIKSQNDDKPIRYGHTYAIQASDERWGLVDASGKWKVKPEYTAIQVIPDNNQLGYLGLEQYPYTNTTFESDCSRAPDVQVLVAHKNGRSYIIDTTGSVLSPALTDEVISYTDGVVQTRGPHSEFSFIDSSGKTLLKTSALTCTAYDSLIAINQNDAWKLVDAKGNPVSTAVKIDRPLPGTGGHWFNEDLAPALINGKCGYLNRAGQIAIAPKFKWATAFNDGFAAVYDGADWRYIDHTGNYATPVKFGHALPFVNGIALVETEGVFYKLNEAMNVSTYNERIESTVNSIRSANIAEPSAGVPAE